MEKEKFKLAWKLLFDGNIKCRLKLLDDGLLVIETGIPLHPHLVKDIDSIMMGEFARNDYWIIPKIPDKGVMALIVHPVTSPTN